MLRATKSEISLDMDCWVEELSDAQLSEFERVANEHNAIKNALKTALTINEGKEIFTGQVFQAYAFRGKVLQEFKEATLPKKNLKPTGPLFAASVATASPRGRKRLANIAYLESTDEEDDDLPLAKRLQISTKRSGSTTSVGISKSAKRGATASVAASASGKASPQNGKSTSKINPKTIKAEKSSPSCGTSQFRPSENNSVGGLVMGTNDSKKDGKDNAKEAKMQGKTYPSLVVLAKPYLKVKDMSVTRSKLDSKVKLVLMLTPNKFCEWLIQEGLLKSSQQCINHRNNELKLGVYSDAAKFPFTGGYVWISECCPLRFVSVFHNSIFEGAQHPPSCILKLIYHWACQTSIQNVVQWVKVDSVYIKGIYTWLRAICTLAIHQKCRKLGGYDKFVEVGVISLGTTSQDGQQRQVKVEVLGVFDYSDKSIRLRAVEPISDNDRNYKKRFQTILEPLQRWVHKESIICIDLTVDRATLLSMGFKTIVQAAATDSGAKHNNSAVMEYLRRIVPRMFQNTLSLLSRQMIQQFLDELVWRENFGTYALQAFNNITAHISEQTRVITTETLTQRLYQVATNPFKDWSVLPPNYKETPPNHTPKRLKKPINDADYLNLGKDNSASTSSARTVKRESLRDSPIIVTGKRRGTSQTEDESSHNKKAANAKGSSAKAASATTSKQAAAVKTVAAKTSTTAKSASSKKSLVETKPPAVSVKKEDDELKGLEEIYYGVCDGLDEYFESFPYVPRPSQKHIDASEISKTVECPICPDAVTFDSNEKLQTHLVSHISPDGKNDQFQCLFCLEKHQTETVLAKHNQIMHPSETKTDGSPSYHCLICQQRHNSLNNLTAHLQKVHCVLELPYCCQACGYRSSSHRDVVRHFYDDHKNQNFLQCPFCLDVFYFCQRGRLNVNSVENYFTHLHRHTKKDVVALRCLKCALCFVDKGAFKQHVAHHHMSMNRSAKTVRLLLDNSLLIPPPKMRQHHREPMPYLLQKLPQFYAFIEGHVCAECGSYIVCGDLHFSGLLKCNKCNYKTCCERTIFKHTAMCTGNAFLDGMEVTLPNEWHCICGFATANGNKLAQHLAVCGQKSAYASVESAHENTVKRNMLDMLGLVRRDDETGATGEGEEHFEEHQDEDEQEHDQDDDEDEGEQEEEAEVEAEEQQRQQSANTPIDTTYGSEPVDNVAQDCQQEQPQTDGPATSGVILDTDQPVVVAQAPIQFGEIEATPVILDPAVVGSAVRGAVTTGDYTQIVGVQQPQQHQPQYNLGYGQTEVQTQNLNASDIDMPLIGELSDPNPPQTQFLSEVHTPMFDAVAAAEQQHYHQMMHLQQTQPPAQLPPQQNQQ